MIGRRVLLAVAATLAIAAAPAPTLDTHRIAIERFGNDAPWYEGNIPFFESSDPKLDAVYYYRWSIVRAHQRDLGAEGYVTTEFLDDVSWQRDPYASLNDASGFHIGEARWLRDRRYAADYIDYMYQGGNDRHFSDYMADAVYGRYLVDGDRTEALRHLSAMRHLYRAWDDRYDFAKGLYWIEPLLDATEYTISSIDASGGKDGFRGGDAFRPSINAYMFANARALARLATLAGDQAMASEFAARAEAVKARVQEALWQPSLEHFVDRYKVSNEHVTYWQPIRGRELVGYLPWTFGLPDDDPRYAAAWKHLLSPAEFAGTAGLRTVGPGYQYYMRQYRYEGTAPECQWNGPVWPFQTTQVLLGLANLLDGYHQSVVTRGDYLRLLRQYAALHFQDGRLDLEEDYHPDTGRPIVGLARSHHYFHSGFVDLILTGLVGIRPRADDSLEVNPLLPDLRDPQALRWFRVQDVPYHGHRVSISWDADGRRFGRRGLSIEVDGALVASRPDLARIAVPLARRAPAPIVRPIDQAVQLVRGTFPRPSASSNADPEALHDAIDGRVWFYPELPNGWSSDVLPAAQWFEVDFGAPRRIERAELAFFADARRFAAPAGYRLQAMTPAGWRDLDARAEPALANGITHARWAAVRTDKVRVLLDQRPGFATRLVELKLF
ncbi:MAG: glycogen debranching protein [Novosphingobium sp.]|nr:glycogen debranching protein [Novosphingobium sp.]